MEQYELDIVADHLCACLPNGLALIDTGAPLTIGRDSALTLLGRQRPTATFLAGVLNSASEFTGRDIRYLIGNDVLAEMHVELDWPGRRVRFATERWWTGSTAPELPVSLAMGVPVFSARHGHDDIRVILDSGAALSYVPSAVAARMRPAGQRGDFYPGVGEFTTEVFETEIEVSGHALAVVAGTLPPVLELTLGRIADGWILGSDFFRDRIVRLSLPHSVSVAS